MNLKHLKILKLYYEVMVIFAKPDDSKRFETELGEMYDPEYALRKII